MTNKKPPPKNHSLSESDKKIFREHMINVRPLKPSNSLPITPPLSTKKNDQYTIKQHYASYQKSTHTEPDSIIATPAYPVQAQDKLFFSHSGLQIKQQKRLKQGKITIQASIDLHGMTVTEALSTLENFLHQAQNHQFRCLHIIHGKGLTLTKKNNSASQHPVLKNTINTWLRNHPAVLAFSSCQPADGGSGAVYVLLKRG